MPTYGYQCTRCENAFEIVQRMSDSPLSICDSCGGELRKKIFPVGIQFKGSGFYVNDYAPGGAKSAKPDTPAAEAKPAAETPAGDKTVPATPASSPAAADTKPAASTPAATA